MIEQTVEIPTKDGKTTTFIVHPERDGPHPIVLFFMDAFGLRPRLYEMAERIAERLGPQQVRSLAVRPQRRPAPAPVR